MDAVTKGFEGDVVRRAEGGNGSAQEELARFQLLGMKLQASKSEIPEVKSVLGQLSEEEQVSIRVLAILNQYPESSAEAAQVAEQTQTRNRFAQARYIAERIVAQQRAKAFYETYGPNKAEVAKDFFDGQTRALAQRKIGLERMNTRTVARVSGASASYDSGLRAAGLRGPPASASGGDGSS